MQITDLKSIQTQIAQHSDQHAYKLLYQHFYSSLYQFALSYLKSGPQAEEAVSDVFIKLWNKRADLENIQNIRLYLFVSTKNVALNYLRTQKRPLIQLEQYRVQFQSVYFDPEQMMVTAEMVRHVQDAIQQLPPRCQLIFKLVKEDGLKYREVAELLNLSIKTVENQMTTALRKIAHAVQFDIRTTLPTVK